MTVYYKDDFIYGHILWAPDDPSKCWAVSSKKTNEFIFMGSRRSCNRWIERKKMGKHLRVPRRTPILRAGL